MHTRVVWDHENREFFKQETPLHNYGGQTVTPGSYTFTFQYQLPHGLPGVFSSRGSNYLAAIMYKVKVWVDMQGFDIKNENYITINENSNRIPQPVQAQSEKSFLFGGSGKLKMFESLPKDIYAPGERVAIHSNIVNDSKKDVASLKVKLMQDIVVRCRGRTETKVVEVHRATFPGLFF
jgi:hypothetical protein